MRAALEARLIADPENEEIWQVFGDFLHQEGDVRGQIIALEFAGKLEEADALCVAHEQAWLEPGVMTYRQPGYSDELEGELPAGKTELFWKYGFVRGAKIEAGWDELGTTQTILSSLFRSEAARFLCELSFEFPEYLGTWESYWVEGAPCLRWMTLTGLSDELVDLSGFPRLFPRLERLFLAGMLEQCRFGTAPWPCLTQLCLRLVGHVDTVIALSNGNFPVLKELSLICNRIIVIEPERGEALSDLARFLHHPGFPALKELTIANFQVGPGLILALLHSPLLPQLTHLSLIHDDLEDEGARLILENFAAFAHLKLDLAENDIPEDLHYALKQRMEPSFTEIFGADPENDALVATPATPGPRPDPTLPPEAPNPGDQAHSGVFLEEKIFRSPDNPSLWKQYANYLVSQQDPRGNLILELLDPATADQAEARLVLDEARWCEPALLGAVVERTWKYGYLYEITLRQTGVSRYNDEGYDFIPTGTGARQLLPEVVFAESARFLQRLIIDYPDFDLNESALVTNGIPSLKYLKLGHVPEDTLSMGPPYFLELPDVSFLSETLPELEELEINGFTGNLQFHGGGMTLWRRLKTLRLRLWDVRYELLDSLLQSLFPLLSRLELTLYGPDLDYEQEDLGFLWSFLSRNDLPLLREVFVNGKRIPLPPR